jgi:hypothetical protein
MCPELLVQPGIDFIVCDAGGSTVDTTLYTVSSVSPTLQLREKRDSACSSLYHFLRVPLTLYLVALGIQAGGIFVDQSASKYFQEGFYNVNLDPDQVTKLVETARENFIKEVKPSFKDGDHLLAVADERFSNELAGIEDGLLTLTR